MKNSLKRSLLHVVKSKLEIFTLQMYSGADTKLLGKQSFRYQNAFKYQLGLVADPVIEAIARLEFEDGLRTGVLPGGCWYHCGGCT